MPTEITEELLEPTEIPTGITIDFLWVPTEVASKTEFDWTVKILIAAAGMGMEKAAGYQGLLATDQELADFLGLSSTRQVQKVIQRGINTSYLWRDGTKQRYLCGAIPKKATTGIKIPRKIIDHPNLTWPKKALYSLVAGMTKGKQGRCFASNAWFGKALGLSAIHIRKLIQELVKDGYLEASYGNSRR